MGVTVDTKGTDPQRQHRNSNSQPAPRAAHVRLRDQPAAAAAQRRLLRHERRPALPRAAPHAAERLAHLRMAQRGRAPAQILFADRSRPLGSGGVVSRVEVFFSRHERPAESGSDMVEVTVDQVLEKIRRHLHLSKETEHELLEEIRTHLEDTAAEAAARGEDPYRALLLAAERFGVEAVAAELQDLHSGREALEALAAAALPV